MMQQYFEVNPQIFSPMFSELFAEVSSRTSNDECIRSPMFAEKR